MTVLTSASLDQDQNLTALASRITAAHLDAVGHAKQAVLRAVDAGILLNEAKEYVQHGAWLTWLSDNCPTISARTAQRYMKLAAAWPTLVSKYDTVSYLDITEALSLLDERHTATDTPCPAVVPKNEPKTAYRVPFQMNPKEISVAKLMEDPSRQEDRKILVRVFPAHPTEPDRSTHDAWAKALGKFFTSFSTETEKLIQAAFSRPPIVTDNIRIAEDALVTLLTEFLDFLVDARTKPQS